MGFCVCVMLVPKSGSDTVSLKATPHAAGYTDAPLDTMLTRSVFIRGLQPEGSLSTSAWLSGLEEGWNGNIMVFTLPPEIAADPLKAATGSLNLARLVKLLR